MKKQESHFVNGVLLVYFAVVLIFQMIYLIPGTIVKTGAIYAISPAYAMISILFQVLVLLALIFGVSQSWANYAGR